MSNKIYHLSIIIFYFIWSLWAIMSLSGCNQTTKNIPSASPSMSGKVTLLWKKIPGASSYNVYMSETPEVTRLSGPEINSATNSLLINQLEPGETYYFVVTVINEQGESEASKELSYTPVAGKIGLVYWKNLFDKSIQEIKATPERTKTAAERPAIENAALSEKIDSDEKSSGDLAKENLQSAEERVAEPANAEEDFTENSKPATAAIETGIDYNFLALEEMLLKNAQILSDSAFYIFFRQDSNELSPKAIEKLDRIYEILANNSAAKLTLNGYSDSIGASSYNQMVSEIRANSVKNYLSGKGIEPSRIMAFGHGAQKFIASNNSAEGRSFNRRVEIELITP